MDRKSIERPKTFDKRAYNDRYQKEHYISIAARVKPDIAERINNYCTDMGISKADFLKLAIDIIEDKR